MASNPHDNNVKGEFTTRTKIQMEIKISDTLENRSGMLFLKLLLADAQFPIQVDLERHRVTRIGRISDVFGDLTIYQGGNIFWKETIVLGLEQDISSSSLGGITEDMNSPDLTAFTNGFLVVKLEDLTGERDWMFSKSGARVEELSIMCQVK